MNIVSRLHTEKGRIPAETTPQDFMPNWDGTIQKPEVKKQSVEEMKSILHSIASVNKKKQKMQGDIHRPPVSKQKKKKP